MNTTEITQQTSGPETDPETMYYVQTEVLEREPFVMLTVDMSAGRHGAITGGDIKQAMFRAEFYETDEDGDPTDDPIAIVDGVWGGGCYIDLCAQSFMASDIFSDAENQWTDSGAEDVVNISYLKDDDRAPYTYAQARQGFEDWVNTYATEYADSLEHDFGHTQWVL